MLNKIIRFDVRHAAFLHEFCDKCLHLAKHGVWVDLEAGVNLDLNVAVVTDSELVYPRVCIWCVVDRDA